MNSNQVQSIARAVLNSAGAYFIAKGGISASGWEELAGALSLVIGVVWGLYHHAEKPEENK